MPSLQAAIDAAVDGDTINVAAGTYVEQITIAKSLQLLGAGAGSSIIQAPANLPLADQPTSNIILVSGSGVDAEITGFTVQGPGPSACGSIRSGIFVRDNANANIHENVIQDIRDAALPVSGCQNGVAILVGRQFWSTSGTATIANNTIVHYQKGGIVVDNVGSNAIITNNSITGAGTISITAQNGIQISRGATATLSGNTISGNSYHAGSIWDWGATGTLLYQAGNVTLAGGNTVTGNDNAIYNEGATALTLGAETIGNSTAPVDSGYDVINLANYPLDLTSVVFLGSADNFAVEDRVWHGLDDVTLGMATWVSENLYVTPLNLGIQAAIDAANDGDTINVGAGTYEETLNIEGRSGLTVIGQDTATTVVKPTTTLGWNAGGYGTARKTVLRVVGSTDITVSNLTFDLDLVKANFVFAGMFWNSTGSLTGNTFQNNTVADASGGYYDFGISLRAVEPNYTDASRAQIAVTGNTFRDMGRVFIHVHGFVNTNIDGNTIYKTVDDFGYGIELGSQSTGLINGNTIYGFDTPAASDGSNSAGIYVESAFTGAKFPPAVTTAIAKNVTISNNEIYGNQWGLYLGNEFDGYAGNVDIVASMTGNNFHDKVDGAVYLTDEDKAAGSSVTASFADNTLINNGGYGYYLTTAGDGDLTVDVQGGSISGHGVGMFLADTAAPGMSASSYDVSIGGASIAGNTSYGVQNAYAGTNIAAACNWWGAIDGPGDVGSGSGDRVTSDVSFEPWKRSVNATECAGPITSNVGPATVALNTPFKLTATVDDTTTGSSFIGSAEYKLDNGTPWGAMTAADGTFDEVAEDVQVDLPLYTVPGVHTVCVRGTDEFGNIGPQRCILLAAYDPTAGFVTGGGWIESPVKDYQYMQTGGEATFGFVSKYKKGTTVPEGNTAFEFDAGALDFHSTSYEWLVVTGGNFARFKGVGTINGEGNYKFQVWAGDGAQDTFRIKIWTENELGVETVVYDNGMDQPIGGGSIMVHNK